MFLEALHHCDQFITLALNSLHFSGTDNLMMLLSRKEVWFPMYAVIAFFAFRRLGFRRGTLMVLGMALTVIACDQISNLIKDAVARLRPCYSSEMLRNGLHILEGRSGHFGFFSAHAANSFGLAAVTVRSFELDDKHRYGNYRLWIMLWALGVSLSRIFVGKHYFGDVAAGACIGYAVGTLFGFLVQKTAGRTAGDEGPAGDGECPAGDGCA